MSQFQRKRFLFSDSTSLKDQSVFVFWLTECKITDNSKMSQYPKTMIFHLYFRYTYNITSPSLILRSSLEHSTSVPKSVQSRWNSECSSSLVRRMNGRRAKA